MGGAPVGGAPEGGALVGGAPVGAVGAVATYWWRWDIMSTMSSPLFSFLHSTPRGTCNNYNNYYTHLLTTIDFLDI